MLGAFELTERYAEPPRCRVRRKAVFEGRRRRPAEPAMEYLFLSSPTAVELIPRSPANPIAPWRYSQPRSRRCNRSARARWLT